MSEQVADVPEWEALLVQFDCVCVPEPVRVYALLNSCTRGKPAKTVPDVIRLHRDRAWVVAVLAERPNGRSASGVSCCSCSRPLDPPELAPLYHVRRQPHAHVAAVERCDSFLYGVQSVRSEQ